MRLFADDAYLYCIINSINNSRILQKDIDRLQVWEDHFNMEFHPKKCKVLTITNKTKPLKTSYTIHDVALESVASAKYLGVEVHRKLKWNTQVAIVCKKANQTINFLARNLRGCKKSIKSRAYTIYVKPILTYASSVWNPVNNQSLTTQIEQIQRKAARFVYSDWSWQSSPSEMMKNLSWKSLEFNRKQDSIQMMHKIVNGNIILPPDFLPKKSRDNVKFQPINGRVMAYSNSFVPTVVGWWNELPKNVSKITDFNTFKKELSKFFLS